MKEPMLTVDVLAGTLHAGWVQWMTAGSGVVHSEMPTDDLMKNGGKMEGFQLWVNLPAKVPPLVSTKLKLNTNRLVKSWVGHVP